MARAPTGESVVTRVVRVLESFDDRHRSLAVAQLAERAGLPVGTAHRIVGQLVDSGLLERDGHGAVHLGIRVWELAALAPACPQLRMAAMPVLAALAGATGRHAVLMVLDDRDVVVVDHLAGPGAIPGTGLRVGRRIPAHAVAGGLVLLAHLPLAERAAALRGPLVHYTPATPTVDALPGRLEAIRRQGWAVADGLVDPGVTAVAVPIRSVSVAGVRGRVMAALAVVGGGCPDPVPPLVRRLQWAAAQVQAAQRDAASAVARPVELPVRHLAPVQARPASAPASTRRCVPVTYRDSVDAR